MSEHDRPEEDRDNTGSTAESEELQAKLLQLQQLEETVEELKQKLEATSTDRDNLSAKNAKLLDTLKDARQQLLSLREEVDRLAQPPSGYGVFLKVYDNGEVDVVTSGRIMRVVCSPTVDVSQLSRGQTVRLNEALTVVEAGGLKRTGTVYTLRSLIESEDGSDKPPDRAQVVGNTDEMLIVWLAEALDPEVLKPGDSLLIDTKEAFAYERVAKADTEDLVLEEVPDISYDDVGGLAKQIEQIRDAVELPFLYADLYKEYELRAPKGILLYGPPGCGKTLIAKAVANSLAKKVQERTGNGTGKAYFLNIKGPELLNKFVGETERQIRQVFARAREKASEGMPVIIFFDEMESMFRTRGSGVSSDVESTIVPQLLTEIDGVEGLENVIVIGASNREDMIDPAVLRPGRLDVKIKVERPDAEAAADIFSKYLTANLPLHSDDLAEFGNDRQICVKAMISKTVERMYAKIDENRFLEVTYANGDKEVLYFKDFNSGAMTENIVSRAKKHAIKQVINGGKEGLRIQHLMDAIVDEFAENEDLPNTTNPDDWARISGKKGERIVYIRTLIAGQKQTGSQHTIKPPEGSGTGQYL